MRNFKLTYGYRARSPEYRTLQDASVCLCVSDEELNALADLQVGQTYVDSDGDTWERVE